MKHPGHYAKRWGTALLLFACLAASSCRKEAPEEEPLLDHIEGVRDMTLIKGGWPDGYRPVLYLARYALPQVRDSVTYQLDDVPAGLTCIYQPTSFYPLYAMQLSFDDAGVQEGDYRIRLKIRSSLGQSRDTSFRLTVASSYNCSAEFSTGSLRVTYALAADTGYSMQVSPIPGVPNRLVFDNINNQGLKLFGLVNCRDNHLYLPEQTIDTATYSGDGDYAQLAGRGTYRLRIHESSRHGMRYWEYTISQE